MPNQFKKIKYYLLILLFSISISCQTNNKKISIEEFTKITSSKELFNVWNKVSQKDKLTYLSFMHAILEIEHIEGVSVNEFLKSIRKQGTCVVSEYMPTSEKREIYKENDNCDYKIFGLYSINFGDDDETKVIGKYLEKLDKCSTLEKFKKTMYDRPDDSFGNTLPYFYGSISKLGHGYYVVDSGRKAGGEGGQFVFNVINSEITYVEMDKAFELLEKKTGKFVGVEGGSGGVSYNFEVVEINKSSFITWGVGVCWDCEVGENGGNGGWISENCRLAISQTTNKIYYKLLKNKDKWGEWEVLN